MLKTDYLSAWQLSCSATGFGNLLATTFFSPYKLNMQYSHYVIKIPQILSASLLLLPMCQCVLTVHAANTLDLRWPQEYSWNWQKRSCRFMWHSVANADPWKPCDMNSVGRAKVVVTEPHIKYFTQGFVDLFQCFFPMLFSFFYQCKFCVKYFFCVCVFHFLCVQIGLYKLL